MREISLGKPLRQVTIFLVALILCRVYFYRLDAGNFSQTRPIVRIKQ